MQRKRTSRQLETLITANARFAQRYLDKRLTPEQLKMLQRLTEQLELSVPAGELQLIEGHWYVTHSGLLRIATRKRCCGIAVTAMPRLSDPSSSRWAFKATAYKSPTCKGFVGHGDADPSNVSPLVRGAEMRVAETRAVNRALRKAYGIGICSVDEIGSFPARNQAEVNVRKLPAQPVNGNGEPKLRDQLCVLIRQHRLDASLVKQYAVEFCGTKDLRQASRQQIQSFITQLAELAAKDREGLLCKLNSYAPKPREGAA